MAQDRITGRSFATRSDVIAVNGMACTSHPLATQAAVDILKMNGNAIDAAIAANAVNSVVEPMSCGIGGDLFALVWIAGEKKLYGLNASGRSPGNMTLEHFRQKGLEKIPVRGQITGDIMKHVSYLVLSFMLLLSSSVSAEDFGDFTADVPAGWTLNDYPGVKYKIVFGPRDAAGFTSNIVNESEPATMSFEKKVQFELSQLPKDIPGIKIVEKKRMNLKSGPAALMILTESDQQGFKVRQRMYMIDGKDKVFVVACTGLAKDGTKYDKQCFDYINSYKLK